MGPLKCSKHPRECWGPFGVVGAIIYSITGVERLESRVRVTVLLLVLLVAAYFFMVAKAAFVDTSSCISKIVEVHSDVLVDLLVMLAKVFDVVAPSSPLEGLSIVMVLVGETTWAAIRSWRG